MNLKILMNTSLVLLIALGTMQAGADNDRDRSQRPLDERTLRGTYVFSGRVLLNPLSLPPTANADRVTVDCFSIGEFRFDGRGRVNRRVEIRCPTTPNVLKAGLGAPPPVGEPTQQEIDIMGSTMTTQGTYALDTDGWGRFSDAGAMRLGPFPGNPAVSAGRILVGEMSDGIAREIMILIDHQSMQGPGAPMPFNSDIGASFVARRR